MLNLGRKSSAVNFQPAPYALDEGKRVYAIGDIHGRADLLLQLLEAIYQDNAARSASYCEIIFLGDLIDRGLQSRQVVASALEMHNHDAPVRFLKGNHEEVFVLASRGDRKAANIFCRIGGRETLLSYGLADAKFATMDAKAVADWMLNNIPREHVDFLDSFEDMIEIGDYAFVHAGVRPNVPLDKQSGSDLRWIRGKFLDADQPFGKMVIHGHSISTEVDEKTHRIGVDTGAYMTGMLTAIGLEGTDRWFLATSPFREAGALIGL